MLDSQAKDIDRMERPEVCIANLITVGVAARAPLRALDVRQVDEIVTHNVYIRSC